MSIARHVCIYKSILGLNDCDKKKKTAELLLLTVLLTEVSDKSRLITLRESLMPLALWQVKVFYHLLNNVSVCMLFFGNKNPTEAASSL